MPAVTWSIGFWSFFRRTHWLLFLNSLRLAKEQSFFFSLGQIWPGFWPMNSHIWNKHSTSWATIVMVHVINSKKMFLCFENWMIQKWHHIAVITLLHLVDIVFFYLFQMTLVVKYELLEKDHNNDMLFCVAIPCQIV